MIRDGLRFGHSYELNDLIADAFEIKDHIVKLTAIVGEVCTIEARDGRAFSIDSKLLIDNAKEISTFSGNSSVQTDEEEKEIVVEPEVDKTPEPESEIIESDSEIDEPDIEEPELELEEEEKDFNYFDDNPYGDDFF